MTFDTSRSTFDPWKDYAAVVMEQGRVQLDSDWNEWLAEVSRRTRAGTLDLVGRAAYPPTTPFAFQITASVTGTTNSLTIGRGRMYVDGLLAENHGNPVATHGTRRWPNCPGPPSRHPPPIWPPSTTPLSRTGPAPRYRPTPVRTWPTSTYGRARSPGSRTPTSWTRR